MSLPGGASSFVTAFKFDSTLGAILIGGSYIANLDILILTDTHPNLTFAGCLLSVRVMAFRARGWCGTTQTPLSS